VALNPRQTLLEIIGRPMEFYFGPLEVGGRTDKVGEMLRHIDLPESFINPAVQASCPRRPEAARLHRPRTRRRAGAHHLR